MLISLDTGLTSSNQLVCDIDLIDETRRVQKTGLSTYIVSLPKKWVQEVGIAQGDSVRILDNGPTSLLLSPKDAKPNIRQSERIDLRVTGGDASDLLSRIVSLYLNGATIITVSYDEEQLWLKQKYDVKEFVRTKLVGTEILSETPKEIGLQVLPTVGELQITEALNIMYETSRMMYENALSAVLDSDANLVKKVVTADDDVDRFNFYVNRQLRAAVTNRELLTKIGLVTPQDCLNYRLVAQHLEHIGDNAVRIVEVASSALNSSRDRAILREVVDSAISVLDDAMKALFDRDRVLACNVLERRVESPELCMKASKTTSKECEERTLLSSVFESVLCSIEYARDIAEAVLELSASYSENS